jgi:hypothetical protein
VRSLRTLAIPGAFLFAAVAARVLLARPPAGIAVDLGQPLVVVTAWHGYGAALLAALVAAILAGAIAYASAFRADVPLRAPRVAAIAAIALAAAWLVPVLFSSDVYAYAAYGELVRLGANPYAHAAPAGGNALLSAAAWQWGNALPVCVYGPAFVALSWATVTALAPLGTLAQLDAMRVLACAALLVCVPLAYAAFPGNAASRLRAAALVGLNPAAIWCAAEGHNDAIALAVVLAGFALVRSGRDAIGAGIVALSALLKPPGIAAAFALGLVDRRARAGAVAGIAVAVAGSAPLLAGIATALAPHAHYSAQASLQAAVQPLALSLFGDERLAQLVALAAAAIGCAVIAAGGLAQLRRGNREGWIYLGLAAWILVPNPYPWYGIWLVALAGLAPRSRAAAVAVLLSLTSLLRYAPDAIGMPAMPVAVALGIAATLPLLGLCYNERPV